MRLQGSSTSAAAEGHKLWKKPSERSDWPPTLPQAISTEDIAEDNSANSYLLEVEIPPFQEDKAKRCNAGCSGRRGSYGAASTWSLPRSQS